MQAFCLTDSLLARPVNSYCRITWNNKCSVCLLAMSINLTACTKFYLPCTCIAMLGHIQSGIAIRLFKSNQNKCTFLNEDSTALVSRLPIFWMPIHVQCIVLYTAGMWWLSSNPLSKQMDCFHNIPFFERELSASELHSNVTQHCLFAKVCLENRKVK